MGDAQKENRIGSAEELDGYVADVLSLVKNPETARNVEARIRARAAQFGIVGKMASKASWGADDATDGKTFVGRK